MMNRVAILLLCLFGLQNAMGQNPPESNPPKMQQLFLGLPYVDLTMVEEEKYHIRGPWKLSEVVAQRFGLDIIDGYDQRLDTSLAYHAAYQYFNFLVKKYKKDALWAYLEGPVAFEKNPVDAKAKKQWIEALDGGKVIDLTAGPQYDFVWGPQVWPKAEKFNKFYDLNPSITGNVKDSVLLIVRVDSSTQEALKFLKNNQKESIAIYKSLKSLNEVKPIVEVVKPKKSLVIYQVVGGDNLGKISKKYNVGVSEIKEWNSLHSDVIRIGQKLTIYTEAKPAKEVIVIKSSKKPNTRVIDPKAVVYVVQPGETLWSISQQFQNLTAEDLMQYNDITEDIRPGDEVLIPPTAKNK